MARKLKDLNVKGKPLVEAWEESVARGLEKADANMARFVKEVMDQEEASEIVTSIQVEIAAYDEIENVRMFILKCPETIIKQVEDALIERKTRKVGAKEELDAISQGTH